MGKMPVAARSDAATSREIARIGPNAVTRLAEALDAQVGEVLTAEIFQSAGQAAFLAVPPESMVDERAVTALHAALRSHLTSSESARASIRAGQLTGDYLLANRIPKPVQGVLKVLPGPLAARVLVAAIGRHSWTFAGSGDFTVKFGRGEDGASPSRLRFSIAGCPVCRGATQAVPACDYYAATFERLFVELVHPQTQVRETQCQANGAPACVFAVSW
jgi:divinyl protochlorophyllide a 8-vinyl-reductase